MGKQKIVISERDNIAVLFDDEVAVEFIIHRGDVLLGDVYLAQVENILPSIDAAFVNVGTDRMGFLHSSDVQGRGDLKNRLQPKQNLVVQVMKEPTGHKGPRVTTNLALPGRFLVMMPESKGISISRKIADPRERARLKSIVSLMKPPGVGVIIRTEAEAQADPEIQDDFETLIERWQNIVAMADTAAPPTLLYRDQDILYRVIREMVTEDVKEIVVDTQFGQHRAQQLLQNWGIEHPIKVTLYNGAQSIMLGCGIDKEIKQALQTRVPLPSGGYLFIQTTEALTVVDVNSGKFTSLASQAETIKLTNLEASKEIARQLRLRNIGGMIIVDFIDMESRADQLRILESFEMDLAADKAKPQIGQLSDLGLVEMTRHRQGQSLSEIFTKKCLSCNGVGNMLEDFNWAPSSSEMARGITGRSKFPVRQQQRGQGQAQGGNGQQQRQVPKVGGQPSLQRFIDPRQQGGAPLREGFLQVSKQAADKQEKQATENLTLAELYQHRLLKKTGVRLSNIVKVACLPLETNSIMIRISAKANDIFTLVNAIEGSAYIPPEMEGDYDYGEDNGVDGPDGYDGGDDVSEEAPMEDVSEEPRRPSAQQGRRRPGAVAVQERLPLGQDNDEYETDDADDASSAVAVLDAPDQEDEPVAKAPRRGRPAKKALPLEPEAVEETEEASEEPVVTSASKAAPAKRRRGRPAAKKKSE